MAKKIIQHGSTTFRCTCSDCGTRFTYEPDDVQQNYAKGGRWVSCPHCGHCMMHFGHGDLSGWGGGGRASWMVHPCS